jgi:hypothetical protein
MKSEHWKPPMILAFAALSILGGCLDTQPGGAGAANDKPDQVDDILNAAPWLANNLSIINLRDGQIVHLASDGATPKFAGTRVAFANNTGVGILPHSGQGAVTIYEGQFTRVIAGAENFVYIVDSDSPGAPTVIELNLENGALRTVFASARNSEACPYIGMASVSPTGEKLIVELTCRSSATTERTELYLINLVDLDTNQIELGGAVAVTFVANNEVLGVVGKRGGKVVKFNLDDGVSVLVMKAEPDASFRRGWSMGNDGFVFMMQGWESYDPANPRSHWHPTSDSVVVLRNGSATTLLHTALVRLVNADASTDGESMVLRFSAQRT